MCPALWTTTSICASSEMIWRTAASHDSSDATSISIARRSTWCSVAYLFAAATCGALRPVVSRIPAYTVCPVCASRRAARVPKPLDAPVMTMICFMTLYLEDG